MNLKKLTLSIFLIGLLTNLFAQGSFPSENGLFNVDYLKGCVGTEITVSPADASIPGNYFLCFDADINPLTIASPENNTCFNVQANTGPVEKFSFVYNDLGTYDILVFRESSGSGIRVYDSITVEIIEPQAPAIGLANCGGSIQFDLNEGLEQYDEYEIDFGDGTIQTYPVANFPVAYTYADNTQAYTINISGDFDNSGFNNCANTDFTTTIVPNDLQEEAAQITALELLNDSTLQFDYQLNPTQLYTVQIDQNGDGSFADLDVLGQNSTGTYAISGLNLLENFYSVRLFAESLCTGNDLISNTVNSIRLETTALPDGNQIAWNSSTFVNSTIVKDGTAIFSGDSEYLDINVLCGQQYAYQISAVDANGIEVVSLIDSLEANNGTPEVPITIISTNVISDSEVEISWQVPDGIEPSIYNTFKKRVLEDSYGLLDTTSTTSIIDQTIDLYERTYFYSVTYRNQCGGQSRAIIDAPNILLQAEQTENILQFNWNEYTGYDSLLTGYRLLKFDADTTLVDQWDIGLERTFEENVAVVDEQVFFYRVLADANNGDVSASNFFRFKVPPSIQVPSAFTPDGDGLNEVLRVEGKFIESIDFKIFNRWGNEVFRSNDQSIGWDGFLNNREAPVGTYSYMVTVTDGFGEQFIKNGVFNLIRRN